MQLLENNELLILSNIRRYIEQFNMPPFRVSLNQMAIRPSGFYTDFTIDRFGVPDAVNIHFSVHNTPGGPSQTHIKFDGDPGNGFRLSFNFNDQSDEKINILYNVAELNNYIFLRHPQSYEFRGNINHDELLGYSQNIQNIIYYIERMLQDVLIIAEHMNINILVYGGNPVNRTMSNIGVHVVQQKYLKYKQKYLELKNKLNKI